MTGARVVIAAVLVALGVSACSGSDPEPKVAPPSSSAPSDPSTSPVSGPTAPTMPAEAMGDDAAAAEAFVRFFWATVNYAQKTGDVDGLRSLTERCRTCDAGIESISDVYEKGGSIRGGSGRLEGLRTGFIGEGHTRATIECDVVTTRQTIDLPGIKNDKSYSGGRQPFQFLLDPTDSGWVVVFMGAQ